METGSRQSGGLAAKGETLVYCAAMSLRFTRLALLLIAGLALGVPEGAEAAPAKAGAKAAKPSGPAKPAKDPDDDDAPAEKPVAGEKPAGEKAAGKPGKAGKPGDKAPSPVVSPEEALPPNAGEQVQMTEDAPPSDMEGTDENPDAPVDYDVPPPDEVTVVKARPAGYPMEEVWRPLTLPRFMTEVALDTRLTFNPAINGSALRARFGVTPKVQIGLVYNIGGVYNDGSGSAFNTGKAVALTGTYQIREWLAAQISTPMYLEPFAASVTLGAPMKFRFGDRYALILAEDVIDIRLTKFVPSLTSEAANEINVTFVDTNTTTITGNFRFSGAGVYQYKPDLAFTARLAVTIIDFDSQSLGYLFRVGAQKTMMKALDLTATMGFDDLGDADETFGFLFGAAFRI